MAVSFVSFGFGAFIIEYFSSSGRFGVNETKVIRHATIIFPQKMIADGLKKLN